jgi:radical SAM-linked protein
VTASVSSHVPKPHTPFQWARMDDLPEIVRKQGILQADAAGSRVRLKWHDARTSHLEAIITRGDRRIADLIELAFRRGCRFDGWSDHFRFETWMEGLEELGIDKHAYLRTIPIDARLPWDHIDVGLAPGFLAKEYQRALKDRLSPPCGKPFRAKVHPTNVEDAAADKKRLVCFDCGIACDLTKMREERIEFLTKLGALRRPDAAADGEMPAGPEEVRAIRARNRRPRTAITNRASTRYRLLFTKLGRSRYLSHLDLVRLLPRIFRRAALPMSYSLGFHPKPRLTFSPALALGWGSRGELLDIHIEGEADPEGILARLNRSAPEGLEFLAARRLEDADAPLPRVVQVAEYAVDLPDGRGPLATALERLESIRSGLAVEILRGKAPEAGPIEVSGAILSAEIDDARRRLRIAIRLDAPPCPRPDDLSSWLCGVRVRPAGIERVGLWHFREAGAGLVSPLDLEAIRGAAAPIA